MKLLWMKRNEENTIWRWKLIQKLIQKSKFFFSSTLCPYRITGNQDKIAVIFVFIFVLVKSLFSSSLYFFNFSFPNLDFINKNFSYQNRKFKFKKKRRFIRLNITWTLLVSMADIHYRYITISPYHHINIRPRFTKEKHCLFDRKFFFFRGNSWNLLQE